jgi:hypothetical protein
MPGRCGRASLGCEPYDARLCRLGQSLVTALASTDPWREVRPWSPVKAHEATT